MTHDELLATLTDRLGAEHFAPEAVEYETTPKGRAVVQRGDVAFFTDERDGEVVAARVIGGRAEFGAVRDGEIDWTVRVLLGDAAMN